MLKPLKFNRYRKKIYRFFFKRKLREFRADRNFHDFDHVQKIGILFDTFEPGTQKLIEKFARELREEGKEVVPLGFVNDKITVSNYGTLIFNRKQLSLKLFPQTKMTDDFLNQPFDLLINAYFAEHLPLEYISTFSKAHFRVGPYYENGMHANDLMIRCSQEQGVPYLLKQALHFLKMVRHDNKSA